MNVLNIGSNKEPLLDCFCGRTASLPASIRSARYRRNCNSTRLGRYQGGRPLHSGWRRASRAVRRHEPNSKAL